MLKQVTDTDLLIAAGGIKGATHVSAFGYNPSIDVANTPEDLWVNGGTYQFPPDTGETVELVSSSLSDTNCLYRIIYFDVDFKVKQAFLVTNGTTPVPLPEPITRVQFIWNVGSTASVGTVTLQGDGTLSTNAYAVALPQDQISLMAIRTVPAGKIGIFRSFDVNMTKATGTETFGIFRGIVRTIAPDGQRGPRVKALRYGAQRTGSSAIVNDFAASYTLPEKTDIIIEAETTSVPIGAAAFFQLTLMDTSQADPYANLLAN